MILVKTRGCVSRKNQRYSKGRFICTIEVLKRAPMWEEDTGFTDLLKEVKKTLTRPKRGHHGFWNRHGEWKTIRKT